MWGVGESYIDSLYQMNEERFRVMISSEVREAMELWEANGRSLEGLGTLVQVRVEGELDRRGRDKKVMEKFWEEWDGDLLSDESLKNAVEVLEGRVERAKQRLKRFQEGLKDVEEVREDMLQLREKWSEIEAMDVEKEDLEVVLGMSRRVKKALR